MRAGIIGSIWGGLALGLVLVWMLRDLPRPEAAMQPSRRPGLVLLDAAGHAYASYGDVVGESLRLADLPPTLPAAAVAIEDRRFWSHPGFDIVGILRAALRDLGAGQVVQGGSTITQQVAKTLFLSRARTFRRKWQEIVLTLWLERHFSKREILEIWLNRVYLGAGAYGVDAASRLYFGVSARRVNLWQAAMLAGLPRAPARFNPRADPAAAAARTRQVLAAMQASGAITAAQAAQAAAQIPPAAALAHGHGWFADWIAEQAPLLLPPGQDAVLHTTLDAPLQAAAEGALGRTLAGPGVAAAASQGAVVALSAADGAVLAMVGGRDYDESPFNRAVLARRQPGSAFKPFVWLAAIEHGARPGDVVLDAPIRLGGWQPEDFHHAYRGRISIEEALAESSNTAAVRLLLQAGGPRVVAAVAHRLGIAGRLPKNDSLALGTGEVGVLELAGAFAPFCNGGHRVGVHGVRAIVAGGEMRRPPQLAAEAVIAPAAAADMQQMLAAVVSRGTGRAAAIPGRAVIGKTGTTQQSRDAWFVGCTGGVVLAIWLGNDDGAPMRGVTGGGLPARLFHTIGEQIRGGERIRESPP